MIVKKIHYCWFGKGKKGKVFKKCYLSWKKYFPDYEIIEWNEDNFDINCNEYVKEAYECKKYAFVSDYARLKIIYENGGIYFDTDVEIIKKIEPDIIRKGFFAEESNGHLSTGLGFSTPKGEKVLKFMMDDYEKIHFVNGGKIDITPCTIRNSISLERRGYKIKNDNYINGIRIFSIDYFGGYDLKNDCVAISDNTFTIHHYDGSWLRKDQRFFARIKKMLSKSIGKDKYSKLRNFIKKMKYKKE